jgi:phosphate transport system substrate-binding protein
MKAAWKKGLIVLSSAVLALSLTACGGGGNAAENGAGAPGGAALSGEIKIDGSSTVFPISAAVAEEFQAANPDALVTVGVSGTGGGFKQFVTGKTDISNASRPIKESEAETAKKNGIEYIELQVAFDGQAVVVNKDNDFVDHLTVEELNKIWKPNSTVQTWADVRPEWPAEKIKLYGPGTDSGTFDYFTEVINGEAQASRSDYSASEDDNVIVQGVAGDKYSLGYFGFAYYVENQDKLRAIPIDGGNGPIEPTIETINDKTYSPLSHPIFIYVNKKSLERPEVRAFVEYHLTEGRDLVSEVGYVQLPDVKYEEGLAKIGK